MPKREVRGGVFGSTFGSEAGDGSSSKETPFHDESAQGRIDDAIVLEWLKKSGNMTGAPEKPRRTSGRQTDEAKDLER